MESVHCREQYAFPSSYLFILKEKFLKVIQVETSSASCDPRKMIEKTLAQILHMMYKRNAPWKNLRRPILLLW